MTLRRSRRNMTLNKKQKITAILTLALIAISLGIWGYSGFEFLSKQQIPVEVEDEFFGTRSIVWKDVTIIGLDVIGPTALAILLVGSMVFYKQRNR